MQESLLRGFYFNGTCAEVYGQTGTPTDITYAPCVRYWPQGTQYRGSAANFNGTTSKVNIGSLGDIDNLLEFTVAGWLWCRSAGASGGGKIFHKGTSTGGLNLRIYNTSDGYVGLYGERLYSIAHAISTKVACVVKSEWHHVAFTYSESGDRKVHIILDAAEVSGYSQHQASEGTRVDDSVDAAIIGNNQEQTRGFDGFINTLAVWGRVLTNTELARLAHREWSSPAYPLVAGYWGDHGHVDHAKAPHGAVCFCFDDAYEAQYSVAKPIFDAAGVVGSVAIITDNIGAPGRLSDAQIQTFIASGWEIESHSKTHADPAGLTPEQLTVELLESRTALELLGANVRHLAWPYGSPQDDLRLIARDYYMSARGSGLLRAENSLLNMLSYSIDTPGPGAIAGYKASIDTAYNAGWLVQFAMHDVDGGGATTLTELIAYCLAKPIAVLTRHAAYLLLERLPPTPLYEGRSVRLENFSLVDEALFYRKTPLIDQTYLVCFLAYANGGALGAGDIKPFAATGLLNLCYDFSYIPVGGGVWFCSAKFDGTVATWKTGVAVQPAAVVFTTLHRIEVLP